MTTLTSKNCAAEGGESAGRKRKNIDVELVERLARIQCTAGEIAEVLGVHITTLYPRFKEIAGEPLGEFIKRKRKGGKVSLRRAQWQKAVEGQHPTMLIWLGKQYLGQTDKVDQRIDASITHPKAPVMTPEEILAEMEKLGIESGHIESRVGADESGSGEE